MPRAVRLFVLARQLVFADNALVVFLCADDGHQAVLRASLHGLRVNVKAGFAVLF